MNLIFRAMRITVFYKLIQSFLMGVASHACSTQNDMYTMSLQYLKKELSSKVDVLYTDKHESILQVDSIIFDGFGQACPKYPDKFVISL